MRDERKKFTLYLHPEEEEDAFAMNVIEGFPRRSRGGLFRNAFIAGLALQQLDHRLPALLSTLLTEELTAEQVVAMISQTTGWKPSQANIRDVLSELNLKPAQPESQCEPVAEMNELDTVRHKMY